MIANEEEGFLEEIQQGPDDDAPRWIYADWLEERGDPRAEFIRVQCEVARCAATGSPPPAELAARERELLDERRRACLAELAPLGVRDVRFSRGLVEKVHCVGSQVLERPNTLFKHAPAIRALLLRQPARQGAGILFRILTSPHLHCLKTLDLAQNELRSIGSEHLSDFPRLVRLATLNLSRNHLSGRGLHELLADRYFEGVASLNLSGNGLLLHDTKLLARSPHLRGIRSLSLDDNQTGDDGLHFLSTSPHLSELNFLSLKNCEIAVAGVRAFAASPSLLQVATLDFSGNPLGEVGAAVLASTSNISKTSMLKLVDCGIGSDGARALAASLFLRKLTALDLGGNGIQDGAAEIAKSTNFPALSTLNLSNNGIEPRIAEMLVDSPHLRNLSLLDLSANGLGKCAQLIDRFGAERIRL